MSNEPLATMPGQHLLAILFLVSRDLDRLQARRRDIMAELEARFPATDRAGTKPDSAPEDDEATP